MTEHKISLLTKELMTALSATGRSFDDHSIFSPSGSAMWAYCSGSLIPNLFCSDTAGRDAAVGTVAHSVGEEWLRSGVRPGHLIGTKVEIAEGDSTFEIEIDHAMLEYVGQYVDWGIYLPGTHFVETRVDFSDLTPLKRQTGTADHAVCEIGKLTITDLKFGQGVQVFAKENTQGVLYAYGFFKKYDDLFDFQTIVIRIAQPRLNHFDEWVISRAELLQWASWLKARAYAAWCKDAVRTPSEKACKWCKVAADCAAHAVFVSRLVDGAFDNLDEPITTDEMVRIGEHISAGDVLFEPIKIGHLTVEQKAAILPYRKMVEAWFAGIHVELEARLLAGENVPGYKIVTGKSNRVFTSVDDAIETLDFLGLDDEVIRPRGMITPAQAEAELMKKGYRKKQLPVLLGSVVRKPAGRQSMAPESDAREALVSVASSTFDNLDEEL